MGNTPQDMTAGEGGHAMGGRRSAGGFLAAAAADLHDKRRRLIGERNEGQIEVPKFDAGFSASLPIPTHMHESPAGALPGAGGS